MLGRAEARRTGRTWGALAFALLLSCSSHQPIHERRPSAADLFGSTSAVTRVVIEVDYVPSAEPVSSRLANYSGRPWSLVEANLVSLFAGSNKLLETPASRDEMKPLNDVHGRTFTTDQVLAIADAHRSIPNSPDIASFFVVWLPGFYDDGTGPATDVLGVAFGESGVVAMFEEAIASTSPASSTVRYVEQATLVHELGHAVGLVNEGIEPASPHHDAAHGAHCTNPSCAMYWANEGAEAAVSFANHAAATGNQILFGPECLADVAALAHR